MNEKSEMQETKKQKKEIIESFRPKSANFVRIRREREPEPDEKEDCDEKLQSEINVLGSATRFHNRDSDTLNKREISGNNLTQFLKKKVKCP